MKNKYLKVLLPHIAAVIVLILFAGIYFSPSFIHGKVLTQSDIVQAKGMQAEITKYKEKGEAILWTNAMFAGMPVYQISNGTKIHNYVGAFINKAFRLNKAITVPYALLFTLLIGFYLLLVSLKVDWKLSLMGAIIFGISTSHVHLIDGGHLNKVLTLAYLAPTFAGALLAFRGKYLLGGFLFAIFIDRQIASNHFQITYYFFFLLSILGAIELYQAYKEGELSRFTKAAGTLLIALLIGIMPNVPKLWSTSEYSKETIRGTSELVKKVSDGTTAPTDGLDKSYAFSWSLGKMETFSLLVPNFMGATSSEAFAQDKNSASLKALRKMNNPQQAQSLAQATSKYWGDQPFTSGAPYYGAVVLLLFFLGAFLVKDPRKWWLIIGTVLMILFSWGRNFPILNYTMFDYFPMFNKFRAVSMAVGLGHVMTVLLGVWGIKELMNAARNKEEKMKALYAGVGVAGGLCLMVLLLSVVMTLEGPRDAALAQYPDFLDALRSDRAGIMQGDALRSLGFILAAGALIWVFIRSNFNAIFLIAGIGLLAVADQWGVNSRYLHSDKFVTPSKSKQITEPRPVDKQILADPDPHYRVLDFSRGNPFSNALTSYFHKSSGGYHAAKLMIYNELIERYLSRPTDNMHIVGMLNTKYLIGGQAGQEQASKVQEALGNAWFVDEFRLVDNANAEMDALADFDPKKTAIIQKKFESSLSGLNITANPADNIKLTSYHPDRMAYESNTSSERLAVFSEVYYPPSKGWKVYIEDQPATDFVKANYVLRALRVPAGKHKIEMRFEPGSWTLGKTIGQVGSLLLMLMLLGGLFLVFRNKELLNRIFPEVSEATATSKLQAKGKEEQPKKRKTGKRK